MGKVNSIPPVEELPKREALMLGIALSALLDNMSFGDQTLQRRNMTLLQELLNQSFSVRYHVIDTLIVGLHADLDKAGLLLLPNDRDKVDPGRFLLHTDEDGSLGTYDGDWDKASKAMRTVRNCLVGIRDLPEEVSVQYNMGALCPTFKDPEVFPELIGILIASAAWARRKREDGESLLRAFDQALEFRNKMQG